MKPLLACLLSAWFLTPMLQADEGMYLLNDSPRKRLKEKYGFDLTDAWLERAVKASVRFNSGGSGGFVSPQGLIVTNHHIAADSLQKLTSKDRNLLRDGFHAKSRDDELKCPDLELNVLQSIEDVTERVSAAVKPDMKPAEAFAVRRAAMATIEKESLDKTRLRSDVVTLYQGGLYHLYRYKKYTDVRLVWAPEQAIASFGGDVDNFEFPRFNLDVAFFRAYEAGKPAVVQHFFPWSDKGPADGDLVFVTGHPGTTNRLETYEKLVHRRDVGLPYLLARVRTMEAALLQFSEKGPDERTMAATDLHRFANARKAFSGMYQGLLDARILETKQIDDSVLKMKFPVQDRADPWQAIAKAQERLRTFERNYLLLERGDAFATELFSVARHLVRMATELERPSADRLREYRDSNLESLRFQLFSPAPVHRDLEIAKLAASLTFLAENLGGDHPLVKDVLATPQRLRLLRDNRHIYPTPPHAQALSVVLFSELADPAVRKKLAEGGAKAIADSDDPMIELARKVDGEARRLRKLYEEEVEEVERQAYAQIAQHRFQMFGRGTPPDATFTLRLAFGVVRGYQTGVMTDIPFRTTFAGTFDRAEKQRYREPFELPKRWLDGKAKLDLATPFNFVSTADTIGGNSGSPVLNRQGQLVGVNFDRNRHGLVRNFVYTDEQARHISVHCQSVLEALRKLYDADGLIQELVGK